MRLNQPVVGFYFIKSHNHFVNYFLQNKDWISVNSLTKTERE